MKNKLIPYIIITVIIAAGSFFGGMQYQKSKTNSFRPSFGNGTMPSGTPPTGMGGGPNGNSYGNGNGKGGGTVGTIVSVGNDSLIVKDSSGNTKTVYYSDSTKVTQNQETTKDKLAKDAQVMISGETNDDKSVTASTIQIMPSSK